MPKARGMQQQAEAERGVGAAEAEGWRSLVVHAGPYLA